MPYPVDVPTTDISTMLRVIKAKTFRDSAAEFCAAAWRVEGYLLGLTVGHEADPGKRPPITEEVKSEFQELHKRLGSVAVSTGDPICDQLIKNCASGLNRVFVAPWLYRPLSDPPAPSPVPTAPSETAKRSGG